MPVLVYLAAARHIQEQSASRTVAETFIDKLTDYCEQIARIPYLPSEY